MMPKKEMAKKRIASPYSKMQNDVTLATNYKKGNEKNMHDWKQQ